MLRVVILLLSCEASTGEAEDPWEYSESVSSGLALDFIFVVPLMVKMVPMMVKMVPLMVRVVPLMVKWYP